MEPLPLICSSLFQVCFHHWLEFDFQFWSQPSRWLLDFEVDSFYPVALCVHFCSLQRSHQLFIRAVVWSCSVFTRANCALNRLLLRCCRLVQEERFSKGESRWRWRQHQTLLGCFDHIRLIFMLFGDCRNACSRISLVHHSCF